MENFKLIFAYKKFAGHGQLVYGTHCLSSNSEYPVLNPGESKAIKIGCDNIQNKYLIRVNMHQYIFFI